MDHLSKYTSSSDRLSKLSNIGIPPKASLDPRIEGLRKIDFGAMPEGRTARASEQTAKEVGVVAQLIGEMTAEIGKLTTTLVGEVIPTWFSRLKAEQEEQIRLLQREKRNLMWTQIALFVSILLTIVGTGWQMWIAKQYKVENDQQQDRIKLLLKRQVDIAEKTYVRAEQSTAQLPSAATKSKLNELSK